MIPQEFTREFEKAAKTLSKMSGKEILFEEDHQEGRAKIIYDAMTGNEKSLNDTVQLIMQESEGTKHLIRALNNLKAISHPGSHLFAKVIFDALQTDINTKVLKLTQILDSLTAEYREGMGWINDHACKLIDSTETQIETKVQIWMHWCAAVLRTESTATSLIELLAPRRHFNLTKSIIHSLKESLNDQNTPWDSKSAALFLLLGNKLIPLSQAQAFVDNAYTYFPLDALEGVEILAIAVENDAAYLAEYDLIQNKLAQIRLENLFLKDMSKENFETASKSIFEHLDAIPDSDLNIALALTDHDKNERMILSAFIDDSRRYDWISLTKKYDLLKPLAGSFFSHFNPQNSILCSFSITLVSALLEQCNADALQVENWIAACDNEDNDSLTLYTKNWISFCNA